MQSKFVPKKINIEQLHIIYYCKFPKPKSDKKEELKQ